MSVDEMGSDDAGLVAFLDGALPPEERAKLEIRLAQEPALKARLDALAAGSLPFKPSYEALSAHAPLARLEAILAESKAAVPAPVANDNAKESAKRSGWRLPPAAVAAALALFVLGTGVGHYLPPGLWPLPAAQRVDRDAPDSWRSVVAEYWGLTTSQTLDWMPNDAATAQRDLTVATRRLGLPLTSDKVALPAQELKRVELFHYDNAPLVEIAYLDELTGPLAFCIYANNPGTVTPPTLEQRKGFNVVYWSDTQRSYMLIGQGPDEIMQKLAAILVKQTAT
ncbi:anti-sigma factor family protein [Labrys neptuniae]